VREQQEAERQNENQQVIGKNHDLSILYAGDYNLY
jgi:hypothetical protein